MTVQVILAVLYSFTSVCSMYKESFRAGVIFVFRENARPPDLRGPLKDINLAVHDKLLANCPISTHLRDVDFMTTSYCM